MADETTPLLDSATEREQRENAPPEDAWDASYRVMLLLPVVIVMTFNHAFHDIAPLFFSEPLIGKLKFRAAAVVVGFLSSLISTPFWSALGDRYGRKPIILVSLGSAAIPNIGLLLVHYFGLHATIYRYIYLSTILLGGFLGGYTTFRGVMYAYTADMVSDAHRLGVFSIIQGFICLSYFALDHFIYLSGWKSLNEVTVLASPIIVALGLALIFTLCCLPESFSRPEESAEGPTVSGTRIWFPSNLLKRSSLVGLALCLYSFIPAVEETHLLRQFWWDVHDGIDKDVSEWIFWQDITMRSVRYFMIIPALAFYYRPRRFPTIAPLQWDLRLAVNFPLVICGVMLVTSILAVIIVILTEPSCIPFCPGHAFAAVVLWLGFNILPVLCNIGGLPTLYSFATGYFQLGNRQHEWGLWFGRLSILQSLPESIISEFDSLSRPGDLTPLLAGVGLAAYLVLQLATAGLVWLSRPRLGSDTSN